MGEERMREVGRLSGGKKRGEVERLATNSAVNHGRVLAQLIRVQMTWARSTHATDRRTTLKANGHDEL